MQDSSLEKQLQQLMSGLEFEPGAAVWENIDAEINAKRKKRIAAWWWLTGGILLLCLSGGILWHGYNTRELAQPVAIQKHTTEPAAALPQQEQTAALTPGATAAQIPAGAPAAADVAQLQAPMSGAADGAVSTVNARGATASGRETREAYYPQGTSDKRHPAAGKVTTGTDRSAPVQIQAPAPVTAPVSALSATFTLPFSSGAANSTGEAHTHTGVTQTNHTATEYTGTALPGMDMTVVLSEKAAAQATDRNAFTPAAGVTPTVVVPQKQKSRWNAYPVVVIGAAANTGGVNATYGYGNSLSSSLYDMVAPSDKNAYFANNPSYGVGTGPGTGAGSLTSYQSKRNTYARPSFRLGLEFEYAPANRWRILTGLQYQHVAYKSVIVTQTLSNFNSGVPGSGKVTYDFAYQLQYMAIPLQGQYRFSNKLAVSAGVMNNIKLSGKQGGESINNALRTWLPSGLLSLDILLPGRKEQVWKLSPYVQYGLKSSFTDGLQDTRMLQLGVQAVWQISNN